MALKTTRWDSASHLRTEQDIEAYLAAVAEEGGDDPAYLARAQEIVARARAAMERSEKEKPAG